jgi:hypothetical protein
MTDTVNVFEQATRLKLRFDASHHNGLSVEQLWDLPLQSTRINQSDLDGVGKVILRELRQQEEESLITPANNAPKTILQLKLDVVKAIISTRQAENAAKAAEATRAAEKATLRQLLQEKHAEELKGLTKDEIEARLKALGG